MQLISRQQAITERLTKYFTGVPCKSGHIAERYTRCSVCLECLHPTFDNKDLVIRRNSRRAAVSAQMQMIRVKIVLHKDDFDAFTDAALLLATCREPSLTREDLFTRFSPRPRGGSTALYAFKCFPDDAPALYQFQESMQFARLTPEQQALVSQAAGRRIA